jgi:hypothetical protein
VLPAIDVEDTLQAPVACRLEISSHRERDGGECCLHDVVEGDAEQISDFAFVC